MASREVWRRIYEFPDYEVNSRGHVRRAGSNQKLIPEQGLLGPKVKLWYNGDAKKVRLADLLTRYFPDLEEGGAPIEWRKLEEFPDYEVAEFGGVRNRTTKYELPLHRTHGINVSVVMHQDGIRSVCYVIDLLKAAFPSEITV